jgi:hypothetical protein
VTTADVDLKVVVVVDWEEVDPALMADLVAPPPTCAIEVDAGPELGVALGTAGLVPETIGFVRIAGVGNERVAERDWNDANATTELLS